MGCRSRHRQLASVKSSTSGGWNSTARTRAADRRVLGALADVQETDAKPVRLVRRVAGGSFEFVHDQMHGYLAARWFSQEGFAWRATTDERFLCALPERHRSPMVLSPPRRGPQGRRGKGDRFQSPAAKLRAGRRHSLELDRAEPVRQMHGERGYQENRRHRYAGQRLWHYMLPFARFWFTRAICGGGAF